MSDPFRNQSFPRVPLVAAALLIGATFVLVISARIGRFEAPDEPAAATVATRELRFEDRSDGSVLVRDARTLDAVAVLERGSNGFVRATMRGLARDRRGRGIGPEAPFRLTERTDGGLSLEDPATGRVVELEAFGRTNADSFARFLAGTVDARSPSATAERG